VQESGLRVLTPTREGTAHAVATRRRVTREHR
jgi:hypothetical protein